MEQKARQSDLVGHVLPRTVVGLALWMLIFAIGAGSTGIVFFVAYERRITGLETKISDLRTELDQKLSDAVTQLQNADKAIGGGVSGTVAPGAAGQAVRLLTGVGPSMASIKGLSSSGSRTSGSGFVLNSTASQSWILTSYRLVSGALGSSQDNGGSPGSAQVTVHVAGADHPGTVFSWDSSNDMALVIVDVGNLPTLQFSNEVPAPGLPVWAVASASGQFGATASKGKLTASGSRTMSTDATVGPQAAGGPLVDVEGKVLGLLASSRNPSTVPTPGQAVPVHAACVQVVVCPQ